MLHFIHRRIISAAILFGIGSAISSSGCSLVPHTVDFVLPDGFQGPFVIIEDPHGVVLSAENGIVGVEVPISRILRVKSWRLLRDQHQETAHYKNGRKIPIDFELVNGNASVAFRSIGASQSNNLPEVLNYFVGTQDDAYKYDWETFMLEKIQE